MLTFSELVSASVFAMGLTVTLTLAQTEVSTQPVNDWTTDMTRPQTLPCCASRFEAPAILGRVPFYRVFNGLLIVLLVMHIYWFALIVRIAWRVVTKGNAEDVRESDSDED